MSQQFPIPLDVTPEVRRSFNVIREELYRREPRIVGWRLSGTTLHVRFLAPLTVTHVQAHLQSDAVGEGGADYDAANSNDSTEIDCRENRMQDKSWASLGAARYFLFLVPVQYDGAGTKILFDGTTADDHMAYADMEV